MELETRRRFIVEHTALEPAPFVPEVRLWTGGESMPLWEAAALADPRLPVPPPYWAWPWAGGQILARHVLDHPELVRDLTVADIGSGGGIVAIAAALAGAREVSAIDIEPYAIAAIQLNSEANGVRVRTVEADPIGTDLGWDVVLAGDVWYEAALADRMAPWLRSLAVRPERRGEGIASDLVSSLLSRAHELGLRELYLLTESAADFFAARGFEAIARDAAPEEIRQTREFREQCPESATLMRLSLATRL